MAKVTRILILGGSWFLGREIAEQAVAQSWQVTTFRRGSTGVDVEGDEALVEAHAHVVGGPLQEEAARVGRAAWAAAPKLGALYHSLDRGLVLRA